MDSEYEIGINLINKSYEKVVEEKDWNLYCGVYPNMDKESFISFENFKNKKQDMNNAKHKTNDEILAKAEGIVKVHQGKHEGIVKE